MRPSTLSEWRIGIVGGFLVALGPVGLALYTPALPAVVADLGTTEGSVKLTMTAYLVGLALAQLVCGPLSDAFGRRPVTLWFLGLYGAGSLACALAPTVDALILARFLQGFGASVGLAIARAIVRDGFTGEPAARLYNLIGLMLAIGPALSPTIGALALAAFDWQAVFLVMLAFGIGLAAVFFWLIPETHPAPDPGVLDPARMTRTWASILSLPAFLRPALIVGVAIGGLHTSTAFMPFVLIGEVGLSPIAFAVAMLIQTSTYVVSTLIVRRLLRRFPANLLTRAGVGAIALAGVLAFMLPRLAEPTVITAMAPLAAWVLGIALVMPGATAAALAPFAAVAGSASALLGFFQLSGGFAGSAVSALFADPLIAYGTVLPGMAAIAVTALLIPVAGRPVPGLAAREEAGGGGTATPP